MDRQYLRLHNSHIYLIYDMSTQSYHIEHQQLDNFQLIW